MLKNAIKRGVERLGYELRYIKHDVDPNGPLYRRQLTEYTTTLTRLGIRKVQYGSGDYLLGAGWVNVDRELSSPDSTKTYMSADLTSKHPFPSDHFEFAFAEDFLEHLTQEQSLIFLSEAQRVLRPGGVLRLSFPGLRGVLRKHYRSGGYEGAAVGRAEAYTPYDHQHFYCEEALTLVGKHLGFSQVAFVDYGESDHPDLKGLDHRESQRGLNIYAELTK
jgi:predicted SAM-dependent methyltransferase